MDSEANKDIENYLRFECQRCAEAREGKDGKTICHLDGQEKEKTDTCPYWRE